METGETVLDKFIAPTDGLYRISTGYGDFSVRLDAGQRVCKTLLSEPAYTGHDKPKNRQTTTSLA